MVSPPGKIADDQNRQSCGVSTFLISGSGFAKSAFKSLRRLKMPGETSPRF